MFYDRVYGNLLIDNQLNLPPYAGAAGGVAPLRTGQLVAQSMVRRRTDASRVDAANGLGAGDPLPGWLGLRLRELRPDVHVGFAGHGQPASPGPAVQSWTSSMSSPTIGSLTSATSVPTASTSTTTARTATSVCWCPSAANNPTAAAGPQNTAMVQQVPFNDSGTPRPSPRTCCNATRAESSCRIHKQRRRSLSVSRLQRRPRHDNHERRCALQQLAGAFRHQFSHGLPLSGGVHLSKEFTNVNSAESGRFPPAQRRRAQRLFEHQQSPRLTQSYGLAAFERPQRVVITDVYNLPSKHAEGVTGKLLSGWSLSGVTTIQSGQPFTITDSAGGSIYGLGTRGPSSPIRARAAPKVARRPFLLPVPAATRSACSRTG